MTIDLNAYKDFVEAVTSDDSNDPERFAQRIKELAKEDNFNPSLLLTGAIGMASESGEFLDLVKKIAFHNKAVTPELREKLVSEAGDVIWYWINACRALNLDPNDVIAANVAKLESRHPNGKFNVEFEKTREKLSYDEWRTRYSVEITDDAREDLKTFHGIDADTEIERVMRKDYEFYLNDGFDKVSQ